MALAPVFLAFIEPMIVKRPFDMRELALGAAMIPGVILVVGGVPSGMRLGIAVGALSALFVAIFGTWNKLLVHRADPLAVTAIELTAGALLLTIISALMPGSESSFVMPGTRDAIYLLVLAVGCTIVPFTLALVALRHLTAFAAQLAVNLEPVYAIVLATLLVCSLYLRVICCTPAIPLPPKPRVVPARSAPLLPPEARPARPA